MQPLTLKLIITLQFLSTTTEVMAQSLGTVPPCIEQMERIVTTYTRDVDGVVLITGACQGLAAFEPGDSTAKIDVAVARAASLVGMTDASGGRVEEVMGRVR